MKFFCCIGFCLSLFLFHGESRLDLLCQKWRLIGIKEEHKSYNSIDGPTTLLFNRDGLFEKHTPMHDSKGTWQFNNDTTKIISNISSAKGAHLGTLQFSPTSDSLIKLTKDTLIYMSESKTIWYYTSDKPPNKN